MSVATTHRPWIQLRSGEPSPVFAGDRAVDGELSSLTRQIIARSGEVAFRIEEFEDQFEALKRDLEAWLATRPDAVVEAFLVLKGDGFLFLVIQRGKAHDGSLEDALTDLDMKVARDPGFNLIHLSVLALPAFAEEAIRSFLPYRDGPKEERGDAQRSESPVAGQP